MKISPLKLTLAVVAVLIIFFLTTFSNQWGNVTAEKTSKDFEPEIKKLSSNPASAKKLCPDITKKLRESIPKLEGKDVEIKRLKTIKLILDCEVAAENHENSFKVLQEISAALPQEARWHAEMASTLYKLGRYGEAARSARLSVQLAPKNFRYQLQEARILAKTPMRKRTSHAYEVAVKLAPYDQVKKVHEEHMKFLNSINSQQPGESSPK
ncbi:MAG: hypothetical protein PHD12_06195 [Methylotenera sp.]|nr:hypothetical protein [Methylotenera sp.]